MDKVAIFIDGGYIEKVLIDEQGGIRIDYLKFVSKIAKSISSELEIFRTYFYHCPPYQSNPPTEEERQRFSSKDRFFSALQRLPRFEVKLGKLLRLGPDANGEYTFIQKKVDTLLSIDLVTLSTKNSMSYAAIVAGDGDFTPAVKSAKNEGISVWLFHENTRHRDLWENSDERVKLDKAFLHKLAQ